MVATLKTAADFAMDGRNLKRQQQYNDEKTTERSATTTTTTTSSLMIPEETGSASTASGNGIKKYLVMPFDYDLTAKDILCGRRKEAFNHVGNRRFRVTIAIFLKRYLEKTGRMARSLLILEIVETIRNCGGHFLKKHNGKWVDIGDKEARNKVGHALRDAASAHLANQAKEKSSDDDYGNYDDNDDGSIDTATKAAIGKRIFKSKKAIKANKNDDKKQQHQPKQQRQHQRQHQRQQQEQQQQEQQSSSILGDGEIENLMKSPINHDMDLGIHMDSLSNEDNNAFDVFLAPNINNDHDSSDDSSTD